MIQRAVPQQWFSVNCTRKNHKGLLCSFSIVHWEAFRTSYYLTQNPFSFSLLLNEFVVVLFKYKRCCWIPKHIKQSFIFPVPSLAMLSGIPSPYCFLQWPSWKLSMLALWPASFTDYSSCVIFDNTVHPWVSPILPRHTITILDGPKNFQLMHVLNLLFPLFYFILITTSLFLLVFLTLLSIVQTNTAHFIFWKKENRSHHSFLCWLAPFF